MWPKFESIFQLQTLIENCKKVPLHIYGQVLSTMPSSLISEGNVKSMMDGNDETQPKKKQLRKLPLNRLGDEIDFGLCRRDSLD